MRAVDTAAVARRIFAQTSPAIAVAYSDAWGLPILGNIYGLASPRQRQNTSMMRFYLAQKLSNFLYETNIF
jgi:hypothetical protein